MSDVFNGEPVEQEQDMDPKDLLVQDIVDLPEPTIEASQDTEPDFDVDDEDGETQ